MSRQVQVTPDEVESARALIKVAGGVGKVDPVIAKVAQARIVPTPELGASPGGASSGQAPPTEVKRTPSTPVKSKVKIRKPKKRANPVVAAKVGYIDYKDTARLRQFVADHGRVRSRRITGVSAHHQRVVAQALKAAKEAKALSQDQQAHPPSFPTAKDD